MNTKEIPSPYNCFTEEFINNYRKAQPQNKRTNEELTETCEKMWKMMWDNFSSKKKKTYINMSRSYKERDAQENGETPSKKQKK